MKILITESQLEKILIEQVYYPPGVLPSGVAPSSDTTDMVNFYKKNAHTINTILQIGTAFIPLAGPFISAAIGLADAELYYKEGDKTSAGLVAAFSMLPFVGSVVSKIPAVKELGVRGMATLASKVSKGVDLSSKEQSIIKLFPENYPLIKKELTELAKKLKGLEKDLQTYKPYFVKKFGENEFTKLLWKYVDNEIDRIQFLKTLRGSKITSTIKIKPTLGGGADHRVFQSTINPNVVFKAEIRPGEINKWYETFVKYPKVFAKTFKKTKVKNTDGTFLDAVIMEKLDTKKFVEFWETIEKSLHQLEKNLPVNQQTETLEYLLKHINEPRYFEKFNKLFNYTKKQLPSISGRVDEFKNIINNLYKITPTPDIRKFNLGYNSEGILKVLDI